MKKSFLFAIFIFLCTYSFSKDYKIVDVELPYGSTTLKATFYCFNDLKTARKLSKELYNVDDLDKILKAGRFKKLIPIPVGSEISAYNFSIMTYDREFWFFENRDDGWLWGIGRY
ncbi:hypothetical protein [Treponema pectinovorum]|uniref:hypothetical protein n=1 Tax=Treponema pectinovorum TaxID=164 RepID=UPI0011CCA534|nr:hypothetical protein [Treponema pectinovorum]